jgi:hypothetical protein
MSAYKGMTRKVRDALITILQGITYDAGSGAEPAFGLVTRDPKSENGQEPYVLIWSIPSRSAVVAVGQVDRTLNYAIFIELTLESTSRTQAQTIDYMSDLTDLTMDALNEADYNGQLHTIDNTIQNWILTVTKSDFKPAKSKNGAVLLCQIDVCVSYSVDL